MEQTFTLKEWKKEGERKFGEDIKDWVFVCPICGKKQSYHDFKSLGFTNDHIEGYLGFSCIGRFNGSEYKAFGKNKKSVNKDFGCDFTIGGLLCPNDITTVIVDNKKLYRFNFAD